MVARLVFAEVELWDLYERMGRKRGDTRSGEVRKAMKAMHYLPNIAGIDWGEFAEHGK